MLLIPILFIAVFGIMLLTIPMYRKIQSKLDGIIGITRENLSGVRVIRAFCREDAETADFDRKNDALTKFQKTVGAISAIMNPVSMSVSAELILSTSPLMTAEERPS